MVQAYTCSDLSILERPERWECKYCYCTAHFHTLAACSASCNAAECCNGCSYNTSAISKTKGTSTQEIPFPCYLPQTNPPGRNFGERCGLNELRLKPLSFECRLRSFPIFCGLQQFASRRCNNNSDIIENACVVRT